MIKFKYYKTNSKFQSDVQNHNIDTDDIVFVEDYGMLSTHQLYWGFIDKLTGTVPLSDDWAILKGGINQGPVVIHRWLSSNGEEDSFAYIHFPSLYSGDNLTLATESWVNTKFNDAFGINADGVSTLAAVLSDNNYATGILTQIANKVDKETGKGLSSNDYTTTEKNKLAGIATGATAVTESTVSGWGFTKNTGTLTSETDPVFTASVAYGITSTDISNWNAKQNALTFNTTPSSSNKVATMSDIPSSLPANGGNAATVGGHTVGKDVPNDAVFTDTTYSVMGASGSNHSAGLVPDTPSTAGTTKFLREDGSWQVPAYPAAQVQSDWNASSGMGVILNKPTILPTPVSAVSGSSVTQQLSPNVFYSFGTMTSLSVTLGTPASGITNEYVFEFDSGSTATTLSLPSSIVWQEAPSIEANKHYEISIKWDASTSQYYGLMASWDLA